MCYICSVIPSHASDSSASCEVFFRPIMKYSKKALTIQEHIDLLRERGLTIADPDRAKKYLESVSYYWLSGYMFHLQNKKEGTAFYSGMKQRTL